MATHNRPLKNHLVRELMHGIRLRKNGDAMVRLAMSGKEVFPVFRYVVNNFFCIDIFSKYGRVWRKQPMTYECDDKMRFTTDGSRRIAIRYIQNVYVMKYSAPMEFRFEKIMKLTLNPYNIQDNESFAGILDSWADIEVLGLHGFYATLAAEVNSGAILLPNLKALVFHLSFDKIFRFVTTTMAFSFLFPEHVVFDIQNICPFSYAGNMQAEVLNERKYTTKSNSNALQFFKSIYEIKRLDFAIASNSEVPIELLKQLPVFIACFTAVKTVKVNVRNMYSSGRDIARSIEFHESFANVTFSVPVEVTCHERLGMSHDDTIKSVSNELKCFGFKEDGDAYCFVIERSDQNLKIIHRIENLPVLTV